jgi:hypothetical protein
MRIKNQSRFTFSILAVAATCLVFQSAQATLLFSDGFAYTTPGNLGGNVNPGTGNAWTAGNSAMTIAGGNLMYTGLQDLGGNELSMAWGGGGAGSIETPYANVTSGNLYYSFLIDVTTAPGANSYLTSLNPGVATPNGSSDALAVYASSVTGGGAFKIGVRTSGSSTVLASTTLNLNQTYLMVAEYSFGSQMASVFIDPIAGGSQPGTADATATSVTAVTAIDDVGFKVQSTPAGNFLLDNLLIGTTWADVTPTAAPEPSALALAGLGLLGLASRFRRARR